jgi:hypothetical protein
LEFSAGRVETQRQVPTFDDGTVVSIDRSGHGDRRIRRTSRAIVGGVSHGRYRREHLWRTTVLPTLDHLRPARLKELRPRHFRNAIRMLSRSVRAG